LIQLLQRAETLEEAHQLESLILNINSANRNPSVNKAMRLGSWCLKRGLIDDATAYFKQANSLDMDYTEALTKLSVLYNQMGHHSKCIYWSNIISQRSPFQYNALTGLAVSLEKLGECVLYYLTLFD
jgi:tetratricopeptide (TPR) repeat protein